MSNVSDYRSFFTDPSLSDEDIRKCVDMLAFLESERFEWNTEASVLQQYVDNLTKTWWPKVHQDPFKLLEKGGHSAWGKVEPQEQRMLKDKHGALNGCATYYKGRCPIHKRHHKTDRWAVFVWYNGSKPHVFCKGQKMAL